RVGRAKAARPTRDVRLPDCRAHAVACAPQLVCGYSGGRGAIASAHPHTSAAEPSGARRARRVCASFPRTW
ncbi:hypothetical protein ACS0VJ_10160, partial [Corynebacterium macclintockiae]|uniref:hypothetical protein n=1 Tax=Corynebacterium macclintockiae TaxID=2913501 RepID=UPI003EC7EB8A